VRGDLAQEEADLLDNIQDIVEIVRDVRRSLRESSRRPIVPQIHQAEDDVEIVSQFQSSLRSARKATPRKEPQADDEDVVEIIRRARQSLIEPQKEEEGHPSTETTSESNSPENSFQKRPSKESIETISTATALDFSHVTSIGGDSEAFTVEMSQEEDSSFSDHSASEQEDDAIPDEHMDPLAKRVHPSSKPWKDDDMAFYLDKTWEYLQHESCSFLKDEALELHVV